MADALMPDPCLITGVHLRSHPLVTAKVGPRSSESLSKTSPAIRYLCASNRPTAPEEWLASMQIECWADVKGEKTAADTARAVIASLADLPGPHSTGVVASTDVVNAFPSPDLETGRPRFLVLANLLIYAIDPLEAL